MSATSAFQIVLVTAPDRKVARALARAALAERLIACANLLPGVESHYRWQGKIEQGREVLLVLKTRKTCVRALEQLILRRHPYDTPEFLVLDVRAGNRRYLEWIRGNCGPEPRSGRRENPT